MGACGSKGKVITPALKGEKAVQSTDEVAIIDLEHYMNNPDDEKSRELCAQVTESFHKFGILVIRDPRVNFQHNSDYIDLMEKYFESRAPSFYAGEKVDDVKPEYMYQVGATTPNVEIARKHEDKIKSYSPENAVVSPIEPIFDAKWRYFWKIGERPEDAPDNFPQITPSDFPDWENKMDAWGTKLHAAVQVVSEMVAVGLGLDKGTFRNKMDGGAHLLAPTGSDLVKNDIGAIFAGFHYDISFVTIHGKSRFPGLFVWTRENTKMQVKVPEGCLICQSGKTFENITGGYIMAGFHEVIYNEKVKAAMEEAKKAKRSTWRISSTMFTHLKHDTDCTPLPEMSHLFDPDMSLAQYGNKTANDILMEELKATNMY